MENEVVADMLSDIVLGYMSDERTTPASTKVLGIVIREAFENYGFGGAGVFEQYVHEKANAELDARREKVLEDLDTDSITDVEKGIIRAFGALVKSESNA